MKRATLILAVLAIAWLPARPLAAVHDAVAAANATCCPADDCCCHVAPVDREEPPPLSSTTPVPQPEPARAAVAADRGWLLPSVPRSFSGPAHQPAAGQDALPVYLLSHALLI